MARKKKPPEHVNHERWLVSYADFITLLFAFFVVMFATSASKPEKVQQFVGAVRDAFSSYGVYVGISKSRVIGPPEASDGRVTIAMTENSAGLSGMSPAGTKDTEVGADKEFRPKVDKEPTEDQTFPDEGVRGDAASSGSVTSEPTQTPTVSPATAEATRNAGSDATPTAPPSPAAMDGMPEMKKVYEELQGVLAQELADLQIEMKKEKRGIVITLKEAGFFDSGSADIKPKSLGILNRIAGKLDSVAKPFMIRVEGHTDNIPLRNTSRYRDNWELSSARANAVISYLMNNHRYSPQNLVASGYAEFHPVADNATPEGRSRNRRVDIVVLNEESTRLEPSLALARTP